MSKRTRAQAGLSRNAGGQGPPRKFVRTVGNYQAGLRAGVGRSGYATVPRTRGVYGQGEMKYFDSGVSAVAISETTDWAASVIAPTTLLTLFCPTEGSAINQRIGRKVMVHKIKLHGLITMPVLTDQADTLCMPDIRVILVQDMQTNAAQMTGDLLMTSQSANAFVVNTGFQSLVNFGRFRVLKDKMFRGRDCTTSTDGANTCSIGTADIPFKFTINFKNPVQVRFNATNGGTVADIVDNSFHVVAHKGSTVGAHVMYYTCRVSYKE